MEIPKLEKRNRSLVTIFYVGDTGGLATLIGRIA